MVYYYKNTFSDSLKLDVNNLGLLRGFSAFEYLRTYNKKPFCLRAHIIRFLYSIKELGLSIPYTLEELEKITLELIEKENRECGIKWYATGGMTLDGLRHINQAEVFAFTTQMPPKDMKLFQQGATCISCFEKRPTPLAKTTAYLEATRFLSTNPLVHEIIYKDADGRLLEAATSNVFFIKDQTLYTADRDILHGITREVVIEIAKGHFDICFKKININDISLFDEAFLTASNKEVLPIASLDGHIFEKSEKTRKIASIFDSATHSDSFETFIPPNYQSAVLLKT
jgi:branched-chain amino acid aminotransferase